MSRDLLETSWAWRSVMGGPPILATEGPIPTAVLTALGFSRYGNLTGKGAIVYLTDSGRVCPIKPDAPIALAIAATPDLIRALKSARYAIAHGGTQSDVVALELADAALAKAGVS